MMNGRHLPAGQGTQVDSGRRRPYNQHQYRHQHQQYPHQPIYQTYVPPYSSGYYSPSMHSQYLNAQAPISYPQYQPYVRSPPIPQYVVSPLVQPQPPYSRPNHPSTASSIHQTIAPLSQRPLSSQSSYSSNINHTSSTTSISKEVSNELTLSPKPGPSRTPFRPPLPWLSRPDLGWPERRGRKKRRSVHHVTLGAVESPIVTQNCGKEASSLVTSSIASITRLDKSLKSPPGLEEFSTDPISTTPLQPCTSFVDSLPAVKTEHKLTKRVAPIVPALPKSLPRPSPNPASDKPVAVRQAPSVNGNNVLAVTANSIDNPEAINKAVVEPESIIPVKAWKTPKLWAGIFQTTNSIPAVNAQDYNTKESGLHSPTVEETSLIDVLKSFNASSNVSKLAFLEPRGLVNTGNMCYMNSILQVLVFCTLFYDFLDQVSKRTACSFKNATPLLDAMILFMREYSVINTAIGADQLRSRLKVRDLEQYGEPFTLDFFYNVINQLPRFSTMRRGHQQDAEEFLGFLLEGLHDECIQVIGTNSNAFDLSALGSNGDELSPNCTDSAHYKPSTNDNGWLEVGPKQKAAVTRSSGAPTAETPITKIFGGNLRSELRVPGMKDSVTLEPFQSLLLDIGAPNVNNIVDALKGLTRLEPLHDDFKSPKGPNVTATKQVFIETLPPVLILHLKRFQYDNTGGTQKIWKKISYPHELEIPREVFTRQQRIAYGKSALPKYRLISAVYHHGKNASGGHYTVDVRRQDGQEWIRIDDTVIRRIRKEEVAEGGSEEDSNMVTLRIDTQKNNESTICHEFATTSFLEEDEGLQGWRQASGSGKKCPGVDNGSTAYKTKTEKFSLKDNKVAYLLFYQKI